MLGGPQKLVNETTTFVLIVIDDSIIDHALTHTKAAACRTKDMSNGSKRLL
jgi:hypothetical protein